MQKTPSINYRDLIAWQKSCQPVLLIYQITADFPNNEKNGLILQLRRASISIPSNIAEGEGRRSKGDFRRFLLIALGSLKEVETHILLSESLGYIKPDSSIILLGATAEIGRLLNGLIRSIP